MHLLFVLEHEVASIHDKVSSDEVSRHELQPFLFLHSLQLKGYWKHSSQLSKQGLH